MKYARVLLSNCPEKTTELFIKYYKGQYTPKTEVEAPSMEPQAQPTSTLQSLAAFLPLSLINASAGSKPEVEAPPVEDKATEELVEYQIPKPRTAFSAFVGHPDEFISFLEALIQQDNLKEDDKIDLYTTLFEMYLDTASRQKDAAQKVEWEDKAKKLIEGKDVRRLISFFLLKFANVRLDTNLHIECASAF